MITNITKIKPIRTPECYLARSCQTIVTVTVLRGLCVQGSLSYGTSGASDGTGNSQQHPAANRPWSR